jgi:hypothetical protein
MVDFVVFGNVLSPCAFLGAVRCFEFVLSECREVDNDLVSVAVPGGNREIFQMLCGIGIDITKYRSDSIGYHRVDIFDGISGGKVATSDLFGCRQRKNGDVIVRHVRQFADIAVSGTDSLLLTEVNNPFVQGCSLCRNRNWTAQD